MHYLAKSRKSRCLFNMTLMSLRISLLGFSNQHLLSYQRMHWFYHSYSPSSVFMGICNLRTWCLETYDLFAIVVEMFSGLEGLHWASSTVQVIKHIKLFHISSCRIVCFETDPSTKHLESFKVLCILISNPFNMMEGFFRPLKISVWI